MTGETATISSGWKVSDDFDAVLSEVIGLEFDHERSKSWREKREIERLLGTKRDALYAIADPDRLQKFVF